MHSEACFSGQSRRGNDANKATVSLDSGSRVSLFRSRDLVSNIRDAETNIELETNVGSRIITQEGNIEDIGKVYFNEHGIVNIFSIKDLIEKHRVTYDSNTEDAFIIHLENKKIKFCANKQGLYT